MEKWKNVDSKIKWTVYVLVLSLAIFLAIRLFSVETKEVIYSNLETGDVQDITSELGKMGIDYEVDEEGKAVSVNKTEVARARIKLAELNLPSNGNPGFELFDESSIGTTTFDKDRKYERALKGQLENDLVKGIEVIESATVQLTLKTETSIFEKNEDETSKATVVIKIKQGQEINESQIKGIQNFVSGAVKNIKSEDVVILDDKGQNLSEQLSESLIQVGSGMTKQMEVQSATEERIKADIKGSLSSIFGEKNVIVNVRAAINFDEVVKNIEQYSDDNKALISKQNNTESSKKIDSSENESTVGIESNGEVPEYQSDEKDDEGNEVYVQESEDSVENYEVGKTVETIKKNPELTNLSVSVYIDDTKTPDTKNEMEQLKKSIALSAGLIDSDKDGNYENGEVEVTSIMFDKTADNDPIEDVDDKGGFMEFVKNESNMKWFLIIGLLVLMIVALISWVIYRKKEKEEEQELLGNLDGNRLTNPELNNGEPGEEALMEKIAKIKEEEEVVLEDKDLDLLMTANKKAVEDPEKTLQYIKHLINEE